MTTTAWNATIGSSRTISSHNFICIRVLSETVTSARARWRWYDGAFNVMYSLLASNQKRMTNNNNKRECQDIKAIRREEKIKWNKTDERISLEVCVRRLNWLIFRSDSIVLKETPHKVIYSIHSCSASSSAAAVAASSSSSLFRSHHFFSLSNYCCYYRHNHLCACIDLFRYTHVCAYVHACVLDLFHWYFLLISNDTLKPFV